jgi:hypothetical protein
MTQSVLTICYEIDKHGLKMAIESINRNNLCLGRDPKAIQSELEQEYLPMWQQALY